MPVAALLVVVFVFIALAMIIALRTPAWESADEPGHVQNIETLVAGHWYRMDPGSGNEAHQAPLYYLAFAAWQRATGQAARVPNPGPNNPGMFRGGPAFRHHSASDHRFLLLLRIPNILLGAATVLLTAWAARTIASDPWTPVVAAAVVAMTPRFLFLSAFVTNDNLATLLAAVLTVCALRFVVAPSIWRIALVGAVIGLLVITKLSTLPLLGVLVVAFFVRRSWVERVRYAIVGTLVAMGVSSWYLIQNTVRYGDPLARAASARYLGPIGGLGTFSGRYHVSDPLALIAKHVPGNIITTFWYSSGWNQFRWPSWASLIFWAMLGITLIGLVRSQAPRRVLLTLAVLLFTGFISLWFVAFQTASYEARLVFTALPALACFAALGMERWRTPPRFVLPFAGVIGVVVATHNNVFAVRWH